MRTFRVDKIHKANGTMNDKLQKLAKMARFGITSIMLSLGMSACGAESATPVLDGGSSASSGSQLDGAEFARNDRRDRNVPRANVEDYPPPFKSENYQMRPNRLYDYQERNRGRLRNLFDRMLRGERVSLSVVQLGDSHTAGDFFTDRVRKRLQAIFGTGSIGWTAPINVPGQRNALVGYDNNGWMLISSRNAEAPEFPMGGYIARPDKAGAELVISPKNPVNNIVPIKVMVRRFYPNLPPPEVEGAMGDIFSMNVPPDGRWHNTLVILQPPLRFRAMVPGQYELGGIWFNNQSTGVTLSAIGLNGAQQTIWNKWKRGWIERDLVESRPDIIIISYGTNEAFNDDIDLENMKANLADGVRHLRYVFPQAVIVIVGAPDSLRKNGRNTMYCDGQRPSMLDGVKVTERNVAILEHTLFWDWQAAMGGKCSMMGWRDNGLAAKDGIHFSESGYYRSADIFVNDLLSWLGYDPAHFGLSDAVLSPMPNR